MVERESTVTRRTRRPRNSEELWDLAIKTAPLEEAAQALRKNGTSVLLTAIERRLAAEQGKFKPQWAPGELEDQKEPKRDERMNRMKRAVADRIADVVATGEPRELFGLKTNLYGSRSDKRTPRPYVMVEDNRQASIYASFGMQMRTYGKLWWDTLVDLDIDEFTVHHTESSDLTPKEKDRLAFVSRTKDQEFGMLLPSDHVSYYSLDSIRVKRIPTIIPGFVLQEATTEHENLTPREVWSFAKEPSVEASSTS